MNSLLLEFIMKIVDYFVDYLTLLFNLEKIKEKWFSVGKFLSF